MKQHLRFLIFGCALFVVAFFFKLFRFPGAGLMIIVSGPCFLLAATMFALKNAKEKTADTLSFFALAFWMLYLIFRLQYWPGSTFFYYIAIGLTVVAIAMIIKRQERMRAVQIAVGIICGVSLWISTLHAHEIYRAISLNHSLNSDDPVMYYESWDKYSWFLHVAGERERAIEANTTALQGATDAVSQNKDDQYAIWYSNNIIRHRERLESNSWTEWRLEE